MLAKDRELFWKKRANEFEDKLKKIKDKETDFDEKVKALAGYATQQTTEEIKKYREVAGGWKREAEKAKKFIIETAFSNLPTQMVQKLKDLAVDDLLAEIPKPKVVEETKEESTPEIGESQQKVLDLLERGSQTNAEIIARTDFKPSRLSQILNKLEEKSMIKKEGDRWSLDPKLND